MQPNAYVLRDHPLFQDPHKIDLQNHQTIPTPDAWKHALTDATVNVIPLVDDQTKPYPAGWCTYTYEHVQAPELEAICGGVNEKTPYAASVWRQGHLLHFGFEQSPAELNEVGRALLVNSITYISSFTEDRPIVRTPGTGKRLLDRGAIDRLVKNQERDMAEYLRWMMDAKTFDQLKDMNREELAQWYVVERGFMVADDKGKLTIDVEAREFGIATDSDDFIPKAILALEDRNSDRQGRARQLLARFVPEGPNDRGPVEWRGWWEVNRHYLIFSDTGGFRWYVDPLAKKRQVPTRELRGSLRATVPSASE